MGNGNWELGIGNLDLRSSRRVGLFTSTSLSSLRDFPLFLSCFLFSSSAAVHAAARGIIPLASHPSLGDNYIIRFAFVFFFWFCSWSRVSKLANLVFQLIVSTRYTIWNKNLLISELVATNYTRLNLTAQTEG
ncbi:hypothetical protein vseg_020786 [Gypsophila vaccaria]